eukprot:6578006-Pyramimonas_sp.AAC.1
MCIRDRATSHATAAAPGAPDAPSSPPTNEAQFALLFLEHPARIMGLATTMQWTAARRATQRADSRAEPRPRNDALAMHADNWGVHRMYLPAECLRCRRHAALFLHCAGRGARRKPASADLRDYCAAPGAPTFPPPGAAHSVEYGGRGDVTLQLSLIHI